MESIEFEYSVEGKPGQIFKVSVEVEDDGRPWIELADQAENEALNKARARHGKDAKIELWEA